MTHEKLKEAFMQGEEREAAKLFHQLLRQSVRAGLFAPMATSGSAEPSDPTFHQGWDRPLGGP